MSESSSPSMRSEESALAQIWFIGIIVFFAVLAIAYLIFTVHLSHSARGPFGRVDVALVRYLNQNLRSDESWMTTFEHLLDVYSNSDGHDVNTMFWIGDRIREIGSDCESSRVRYNASVEGLGGWFLSRNMLDSPWDARRCVPFITWEESDDAHV